MARVLDVFLDLPLLPTGSRIAELRLEQEVADHGCKPCVDLAVLAAPDFVDRSAHVVVDASPGNAAQHAEGVVMGVEQHLVGLLRVGPENESAAVGELEVSDLQFGPLAAEDRPIFRQSNWNASPGRNASGTNTRRPHVFRSCCRAAFQSRAKAATRL